MLDQSYLLNNEAMQTYLVNGYVTVQSNLSADFHAAICEQVNLLFEREGNPRNTILDKVPALRQVLDDPAVRGALTSILGPNYMVHAHRHCHLNPPGTDAQGNHQDSYEDDKNVRHHRSRWAMAFYYPQDVTADNGPSGVTPCTHYLYDCATANALPELALTGQAGTVTIIHYDLWHRALANRSHEPRFMTKFLFCRMEEPRSPSWNVDSGVLTQHFSKLTEPPESLVKLQIVWQTLWRWHWGTRAGTVEHADVSNPQAVPDLIQSLQSKSEVERLRGAYTLGDIGESAVPALIEALIAEAELSRDPNLNRYHTNPSQLYSRYALSAVGSPAVQATIETLSDARWWVRAAAADILGDIGLASETAVPALGEAVQDESDWVRRNAIEALGVIGASAQPATGAIAGALGDDVDCVRHNAALALARIGPAAQEATRELTASLDDKNEYVRSYAAIALSRIEQLESN